ncbi:MAG: hypothetical protein ACK5IQ_09050 [Bacteroidales bacterium]
MKICLISYDFWNYDGYIVDALKKKSIDAYHIKMYTWQYPNRKARVRNMLSKTFLKKNLKTKWRQMMVLEKLEEIGKQDQILIINPEYIELEFHTRISKYTDRYVAFLYDSLARNPAKHTFHFFDKIFTFDYNDATETPKLEHINNYIYWEHLPAEQQKSKVSLTFVASADKERDRLMSKLIANLIHNDISYFFHIVGKSNHLKKKFINTKSPNGKVINAKKSISHQELKSIYSRSVAILDIVREQQTGLSFRFFEAMALEKKVITNNHNVKNYEFYNPNNIMILDQDMTFKDNDFFNSPYEKLPKEIYEQYTISHWVEKVFNL